MLFYLGSLYHGGGANRSAATRDRASTSATRVVVAPGGEPVPRVPARGGPRAARADLLRLMGYDRGAYALGYFDDLRDPIEAVRPRIRAQSVSPPASGGVRASSCRSSRVRRAATVWTVPVVIREATDDDIDELYGGFARIVATKEGFPQVAPLTRADFDGTWVVGSSAVCVARSGPT